MAFDMKGDKEITLILGRPFLTIGRIMIGVQKEEFIIRAQDHEVKINVFNSIKYLDNRNEE